MSEKVIVAGPGNAGIGTNDPGYRLHANGSAAATSWTTEIRSLKARLNDLTAAESARKRAVR